LSFSAADHEFMARALLLASRGLFTTSPNPRVGCVVVRDGVVVGEGWHECAGAAHAEVNALLAAGDRGRGTTAYVNLEPCCHHGRTPPCVEALVAAGVTRVVAAMADPNPLVAGQGLAMLAAAGITVDTGLLEAEAREMNIGFVSRMTRGRPWLRLKLAASLDGKTALLNGRSQWITGFAARRDGHRWRARACAILTGIGTVRDDDPSLTVRDVETPRQPLRVVVDSRLDIPLSAKVLHGGDTLIATATENFAKRAALVAAGAEVLVLPNDHGKVDLEQLLRELASRGINEIHVEAGFKLNGSLLSAGLVDELLIYQAPTVLGDHALGMFDLASLAEMSGRRDLQIIDQRSVGADLRLLARWCQS
jgi:diaminohydroxyphosphoribosylaminopyrimidine deaminase/5-amino-6-(5-phosphoribosylamino)uracil reductase